MTYQGTGVNTTLDQLVSQLATQHAATAAQLAAIATAIGAPPPTGTVTLADVLTAIEATNTKLDALAGYLSTIATQTNLTRVALDSWIDDWFSGTGGLQYLENIYFGNQDIRNAILATACPCTGDNPILPAPGGTTPFPTEAQQEKCKRAQKFVDWFLQEILIRVRDIYSTYGFIGASAIGVLLSAALVALAPETAGTSLIPAIAIASIVALIGSVASSQIGQIVSYYNTSAVKNALIQAIYTADTATDAKAAFDAAFDAFSDIPTPIKAIWRALALQLFFDQTFDPAREIDTSGYDGTICGIAAGEWITYVSNPTVASGSFSANMHAITDDIGQFTTFTPVNSLSGNVFHNPPSMHSGNIIGWQMRVISGIVRFTYRNEPPTSSGVFSVISDITSASNIITLPETNHFAFDDSAANGPFVIQLKAP
jgi:hypothetical protein